MKLAAALLIAAVPSYHVAKFYTGKAQVPGFPAFTTWVEESSPKRPCLGSGAYDQKVTVLLENSPIARIEVNSPCANENDLGTITIFRPSGRDLVSEVCNSCPEEGFATALAARAKEVAWQQSKEKFVDQFVQYLKERVATEKAQRVIEATPDNGTAKQGTTTYSIRPSFVPQGDEMVLSYTENGSERSFLLYVFTITKKGADVKIYYDANADTTIDAVLELKAEQQFRFSRADTFSLEKAIAEAKKKNVQARKPTPDESEFGENYLRGLLLGRIQL